MMFYAIIFMSGFFTKALIDGIISLKKQLKEKKEIEQKFKQVLRKLRKGKSKFKTRVNETVYIDMDLNEIGNVDIILFLDTKKVAIFKDSKCLHISDSINDDFKNEIVNEIEKLYNSDIEDVIELLGNKISKKEIDNKLNEFLKNSKIDDVFKVTDMYNQITDEENEEKTYTEEDINIIFDKISKDGLDSISEEEKRILDEYSKNLKQ